MGSWVETLNDRKIFIKFRSWWVIGPWKLFKQKKRTWILNFTWNLDIYFTSTLSKFYLLMIFCVKFFKNFPKSSQNLFKNASWYFFEILFKILMHHTFYTQFLLVLIQNFLKIPQKLLKVLEICSNFFKILFKFFQNFGNSLFHLQLLESYKV